MILLVTGVAGFIGCNFVYYYIDKYQDDHIIGLDKLTYAGNLVNLANLTQEQRKRFTFVKGDINDKKLIKKIFLENEIDGVINFAAESHVDRSIQDSQVFIKTNVLGTHNLLDISTKFWYKNGKWSKNKKFLQISTDEVYGSVGEPGLFTEKTPLDPHSPYSASKASADLIVTAYYSTYKIPVNIVRCSNNYGPYQFPEKFIPLMINSALNHRSLPIYGDGKQIRDWLYVKDHCRAIDIVFKNGKIGEIYNIGGRNERENITVVKMLIEILRKKTGDTKINQEMIEYVKDRPGHDRRYAIDPTKMENELAWKAKVSFMKGLEKTVEWYLQNQSWLDKVTSGDYL